MLLKTHDSLTFVTVSSANKLEHDFDYIQWQTVRLLRLTGDDQFSALRVTMNMRQTTDK